MNIRLGPEDCLGFIRPSPDAHTLGLGSIGELLAECGIRTATAGRDLAEAVASADEGALDALLRAWIRDHRVSAVGLSYRLDPEDGARAFGRLAESLERCRLLERQGGPVRALYFAGLPPACEMVRERFPFVTALFHGDETPSESLSELGVDPSRLPASLSEGVAYDDERLAFGRGLMAAGNWRGARALSRDYPGFGERGDGITKRIDYHKAKGLGPLMRAHVGPYLPDRREAVDLFLDWTKRLAASGLLDVLSIGSSQLTQEAFGSDWKDRPNGGGVPLNSEKELAAVWRAARPMLVRAYSGVRDTAGMAAILERTIDIAWHALSFWWFCALDGRGPNPVRENLAEHFRALRFIAASGKPFEPNVPHHFAFRGADDVSYVVAGYAAARAARDAGVRTLVLQVMFNTPKYTHGVQDLAKARALLTLARGLEGPGFKVILQPRGGLDYFSHVEEKAKAQLAAVTAMMDDIEPDDPASPQIIHVVSWSEGSGLADPTIVDDSIRITRQALAEYRGLKAEGAIWTPARADEVGWRTERLLDEARTVIRAMESRIPDTYGPAGMYRMLAEGWFALPWLSELRDEFAAAAAWRTRILNGGVALVDADGKAISAADRVGMILERRAHGALAR